MHLKSEKGGLGLPSFSDKLDCSLTLQCFTLLACGNDAIVRDITYQQLTDVVNVQTRKESPTNEDLTSFIREESSPQERRKGVSDIQLDRSLRITANNMVRQLWRQDRVTTLVTFVMKVSHLNEEYLNTFVHLSCSSMYVNKLSYYCINLYFNSNIHFKWFAFIC